MHVYRDRVRLERPTELLERLAQGLDRVESARPGMERHGRLVALLLEAGELAQGLLDSVFRQCGEDGHDPVGRASLDLTLELARAVWISHRSQYERFTPLRREALHALRRAKLPAEMQVSTPEGYAFHALYPEVYGEAAQSVAGLGSGLRVIGIRSIGTSLASMVCAAANSSRPAVTLRPVGDPFDRRLAVSRALTAQLAGSPVVRYAIVDEGPGLSGSSFAAVADFLERRGVPPARIEFFPGHLGPLGPMASEKSRFRWESTHKHAISFAAVFIGRSGPSALPRWADKVIGSEDERPEDFSAGGWRHRVFASQAEWPAVHVQQERRKYLLRAGGRLWLAKFAGLGSSGERAFERARVLAAGGFTPPETLLRHGFVFRRWLDDAKPLSLDRGDLDRDALLARVGDYLAFRVQQFPTQEREGASPAELWAMARQNVGEGLGAEAVRALERIDPSALQQDLAPVATDNRMQAWEWLVLPSGEMLKADAVDHCAGHDLAACQDVAWDVAGAAVELDLSADEERRLADRVEAQCAARLSPQKRLVYRICYLAFHLGKSVLAEETLQSGHPDEAGRWRVARARYALALREALGLGEEVRPPASESSAEPAHPA